MDTKGKLYLLPSPLGEEAVETIPPYVIGVLHSLSYLVAERAKTTRHFIKRTNPPKPIQEYIIHELNSRTTAQEMNAYIQPALNGESIGLLSEAGCPGVADPGAALVALAHSHGIEVVPLVGPSSILLALMAAGMDGQRFCFHGYLPAKAAEMGKDLKRLEQQSERENQTQIFIETPYRNRQVVDQALQVLLPETHFCIAADLTLPSQFIVSRKIKDFNLAHLPDLHKRPAIFLLYVKR
ncbi:MAG: SAM-dependent methyltransferase [Lewinellaceae bacterium]|nr:SAM-dependent methyltransferase [Saprospiraceae bacterium]MCB9338158.1 SAM-dependent methyltransferase [Lewinellaceae bacterium]